MGDAVGVNSVASETSSALDQFGGIWLPVGSGAAPHTLPVLRPVRDLKRVLQPSPVHGMVCRNRSVSVPFTPFLWMGHAELGCPCAGVKLVVFWRQAVG